MKKIYLIIIIVVSSLAFVSVGTVGIIHLTKHRHNYQEQIVSPTCTLDGYTLHICSCGKSYQDNVVDKLGHNYQLTTTITASTCLEDGQGSYTCSRCNDTKTDIITHLGHDLVTSVGIEATCTLSGISNAYSCKRCDYKEEAKIIPAKGHTYVQTEVLKAPTCIEEGIAKHVCSVCDDVTYVKLNIIDHNYAITVVNPTCTESGYTLHTCSVCEDMVKDNYLDKLNHDYHETVIEANCSHEGYRLHECSRCDDSYKTDFVAKTSHDYLVEVIAPTENSMGYTKYTCKVCNDTYKDLFTTPDGHEYHAVVTKPTCTESGYTTYTCSHCDSVLVDDYVTKLGHDYLEVVTNPTCLDGGYTTHICSRCDDFYEDSQVLPLDHDYKVTVISPTCITDGYTHHKCSRCDDEYTDAPTTKLGHDYQELVVKPTCEENGYTIHLCSRCGDSYEDSLVSKLGHDYKLQSSTSPTCTKSGVASYYCTHDEHHTKTEEIAALGHDYEDTVVDPTCLEFGYTLHTCKRCHIQTEDTKTDPLDHDYQLVESVIATCTKAGYFKYVCSRDETHIYQNDVNVLGHNYKATVIPATCESPGYTEHECLRCHDKYTDNNVNKLGHDYRLAETLNATCTLDGKKVYVCQNDETHTYTDILPKLGHDISTTTISPTCTEQGYKLDSCSRCDYENKHDYTSALGHNYVETSRVAESCESNGSITYTCQNDSTHIKVVDVDMIGHKDVIVETVAVTCLTDGYTKYHCTECNRDEVRDIVSALGHSYEENYTTDIYEHYLAPTCGHDVYKNRANHSFDEDNTCTICNYQLESTTTVSYTLVNDTYQITSFSGSEENIIIPDYYNGKKVTSLSANCFQGNSNIKSIRLSNYLEMIPVSAFENCSSLETVTFSNIIKSIPARAFSGCSSLKNIDISNCVTIGQYAFNGCTSLEKVLINDNVGDISRYAFSGCTNLSNVSINPTSKLNKVSNHAFEGCSKLESITFGNYLTSIEEYAFNNCSKLRNVIIPNGLSEVSNYTFANTIIGAFDFTNTLTVGDYAFYNANCILKNTLGLTSIGQSAFSKNTTIDYLYLGENLTSIGDDAFKGCTNILEVYNISSISLTLGETSNGYAAYYAKSIHTDLSDPKTYYFKGDFVFEYKESNYYLKEYNGSLKDIVLPDDVEANSYIISDLFKASSINSIVLGSKTTSIVANAFKDCKDLYSITLNEELTSIDSTSFSGCYRLLEVINHSSLNVSEYFEEEAIIKTDDSTIYTKTLDMIIMNKNNKTYLVRYLGTSKEVVLNVDYVYSYAFENKTIDYLSISNNLVSLSNGFEGIKPKKIMLGLNTNIVIDNSLLECIYFTGNKDADKTNLNQIKGSSLVLYYSEQTPESGCDYWHYVNEAPIQYETENHSYNDGNVITAPTCISAGLIKYTCTVCGHEFDDETPQTGIHVEYDTDNRCLICGDVYSYSENLVYEDILSDSTVVGKRVIGYTGNDINLVIPYYVDGIRVTEIKEDAFKDTNIITLSIPSTVTSIDSNAFRGATRLVEIYNGTSIDLSSYNIISVVDKKSNSKLYTVSDYLFIDDATNKYLVSYNKTNSKVSLPTDFNYTIYSKAFVNCNLTEVTIPSNATLMDNTVFNNNPKLYVVYNLTGNSISVSQALVILTDTLINPYVTLNNNSYIVGDEFAYLYKTEENKLAKVTSKINDKLVKVLANVFTNVNDIIIDSSVVESFATHTFDNIYYVDSTGLSLTANHTYYYSEEESSDGCAKWHYVNDVPTLWSNSHTYGLDNKCVRCNHEFEYTQNLIYVELIKKEVGMPDQVVGYAIDGYEGNKDLVTSIIVPYGHNNLPVTKIISLSDFAFVTEIYVGGNVEVIESKAFDGSDSLQKLIICENVREVSSDMTINCHQYVMYNLSTTVVGNITDHTIFNNCTAIKKELD